MLVCKGTETLAWETLQDLRAWRGLTLCMLRLVLLKWRSWSIARNWKSSGLHSPGYMHGLPVEAFLLSPFIHLNRSVSSHSLWCWRCSSNLANQVASLHCEIAFCYHCLHCSCLGCLARHQQLNFEHESQFLWSNKTTCDCHCRFISLSGLDWLLEKCIIFFPFLAKIQPTISNCICCNFTVRRLRILRGLLSCNTFKSSLSLLQ